MREACYLENHTVVLRLLKGANGGRKKRITGEAKRGNCSANI
jgi:hypothetical protein